MISGNRCGLMVPAKVSRGYNPDHLCLSLRAHILALMRLPACLVLAEWAKYRARDTRLERTVAIKILPAHLSSDPLRKQRFEREAKTISSLNHPHVCRIFLP